MTDRQPDHLHVVHAREVRGEVDDLSDVAHLDLEGAVRKPDAELSPRSRPAGGHGPHTGSEVVDSLPVPQAAPRVLDNGGD